MVQVESQSLAPGTNGDRKIIRHGDAIGDLDIPDSTVVELPPDYPPESFWLSKDAEFDWFDRNAFLERKESTRGNINSKNLNPIVNPSHSNSSSLRYSVSNLKPKAPIIGLPKTQKTSYVDLKCRRCKPINVRLFPKQLNSVGTAPATDPVTEPSSPKVSCIGRVRSKRCRSRGKSPGQPVEPMKSGLMSCIISLFRCKSSREKVKKPAERSGSRRICVSIKPVNSEPSEPGGLGGMMRFASGRRSDYRGGLENEDVA